MPVVHTFILLILFVFRIEDFLLLDDVLDSFNVTQSEFMCQGTSVRHVIKQLPIRTLFDAHQDSIYYENFATNENDTIEVIRKVDSTQLIAKLDKNSSPNFKRAKAQ